MSRPIYKIPTDPTKLITQSSLQELATNVGLGHLAGLELRQNVCTVGGQEHLLLSWTSPLGEDCKLTYTPEHQRWVKLADDSPYEIGQWTENTACCKPVSSADLTNPRFRGRASQVLKDPTGGTWSLMLVPVDIPSHESIYNNELQESYFWDGVYAQVRTLLEKYFKVFFLMGKCSDALSGMTVTTAEEGKTYEALLQYLDSITPTRKEIFLDAVSVIGCNHIFTAAEASLMQCLNHAFNLDVLRVCLLARSEIREFEFLKKTEYEMSLQLKQTFGQQGCFQDIDLPCLT